MADSISNSEDVIDSRDVIARIDELESERDDYLNSAKELVSDDPDADSLWEFNGTEYLTETEAHAAAVEAWNGTDEGEELNSLLKLQEQSEGYSDWTHGVALIRDSHFENYARELAEDLHGAKIRDAEWPFSCIDWEKAANDLQTDYTSVDFDGVDYWVH